MYHPQEACKDGRYGSKHEERREKAPKDERLDRHHANSSSDFWEDQELQGTRIKGPKRYHSREEGDYYEDSLEESHHANGSSSFQEDRKLQKTGITQRTNQREMDHPQEASTDNRYESNQEEWRRKDMRLGS